MLVVAGAGVLLVGALGALHEIQIELVRNRLAVGSVLDLNDDGEVISLRKSDVGNQHIALLFEFHAGRIRTIPTDYFHDLLADWLEFFVVGDTGDLDLTILGHEELQVGFDTGEETTAIRTVLDALVIMVMPFFAFGVGVVIALFVTFVTVIAMVVFGMVVVMIVTVFFFGAGNRDQRKGDRGENESERFHRVFHSIGCGW